MQLAPPVRRRNPEYSARVAILWIPHGKKFFGGPSCTSFGAVFVLLVVPWSRIGTPLGSLGVALGPLWVALWWPWGALGPLGVAVGSRWGLNFTFCSRRWGTLAPVLRLEEFDITDFKAEKHLLGISGTKERFVLLALQQLIAALQYSTTPVAATDAPFPSKKLRSEELKRSTTKDFYIVMHSFILKPKA